MLVTLLVGIVHASKLVFDNLSHSNRACSSSYSAHELRMGANTKLKLKNDMVQVEGLGGKELLFCFREGNLHFPLNSTDDEMPVEEGDEFIWLGFQDPAPQALLDAIGADDGLTEEQVLQYRDERTCVYTFTLTRDLNLRSLSRNHWASCRPTLCHPLNLIYLAIPLIFISIFLIVTFDCWNPRNHQYMELQYLHRGENVTKEHFYLQVGKACLKQEFTDAMWERAQSCLRSVHPDLDSAHWSLWKYRPFIYASQVSLPVCGFNGNISN